MPSRRRARALLIALTALLATSGTVHFARPQTFDPIVPDALPGEARTWTLLSGAAELTTAAALALPATRRAGGGLAALLFVAVFPANVTMAAQYLRSPRKSRTAKAVALVRLPLQVPLVLGALAIRRAASR
ncbi:DoxX family protein [Frondihabitans australicus]|uniref:Putative membrane protein n=1 Tax=Frondihabitans australicus TaxID=386892 RepID=A0A495IG25_9MICO|nr:hypothetical protein [Frondihabitans australicus]RKR74358.1 putative membrane protein [Frondihabitans australicus]